MKIAFLVMIALLSFAGNSIIARLALLEQAIDPASFTFIRVLSGAVALWLILQGQKKRTQATALTTANGSWWGAVTLSGYAIAFSYAYLELETGFGAFVLFASVQFTMLTLAIITGKHLSRREWIGVLLALSGFIYLLLPSLQQPASLLAVVLMASAGMAWGLFSVHGRSSQMPLADTSYNFIRAVPLVLIALWLQAPDLTLSKQGIILAVISGVFTSGIGYAVWYLVLPKISIPTAAIGQLLVPLLAAIGGVLVVGEVLTLHLLIAALAIIGGMLLLSIKRP